MTCHLVKCPQCHRLHALCWLHTASDKHLGVICDLDNDGAFIRLKADATDHIPVESLQDMPAHYTPAAKKAAMLKEQLQMPLMNVRPDEVVERLVELAKLTDYRKISELRLQIDQLLQAAKEVDAQIEALDIKRRDLRDQAAKAGAELSNYQTEPLFKDEL